MTFSTCNCREGDGIYLDSADAIVAKVYRLKMGWFVEPRAPRQAIVSQRQRKQMAESADGLCRSQCVAAQVHFLQQGIITKELDRCDPKLSNIQREISEFAIGCSSARVGWDRCPRNGMSDRAQLSLS